MAEHSGVMVYGEFADGKLAAISRQRGKRLGPGGYYLWL
jgi:hypothetical protein